MPLSAFGVEDDRIEISKGPASTALHASAIRGGIRARNVGRRGVNAAVGAGQKVKFNAQVASGTAAQQARLNSRRASRAISDVTRPIGENLAGRAHAAGQVTGARARRAYESVKMNTAVASALGSEAARKGVIRVKAIKPVNQALIAGGTAGAVGGGGVGYATSRRRRNY